MRERENIKQQPWIAAGEVELEIKCAKLEVKLHPRLVRRQLLFCHILSYFFRRFPQSTQKSVS